MRLLLLLLFSACAFPADPPVSIGLGPAPVSASDFTGILPTANGGTGVNNAGTITNATAITFTGGGTLALGGFTWTIPGTDTAVGLAQNNAFTGQNSSQSTLAGASVPIVTPPTWNNAATVFTGAYLNFIDTASNVASLALVIQRNSGTIFNIDKFGDVTTVGNVTSTLTTIVERRHDQCHHHQHRCHHHGW